MDAPEATTLLGLVERFSPTGQEGEAVAWLVSRMHALGYDRSAPDAAGNAVGVIGEGPRQVVLLGHIDTVPGRVPVRVEGGVLYGRGAVDAKGPLAAFVDAAARLGKQPGWQIVVIGAVDEEGDSAGARYAAGPYRPDYAIIGEPSRWERVTLGYKGSAAAELAVKRPAAHSAAQAQNACETAFETWGAIRGWCAQFNQGRARVFDQLSPSLRGFASGSDGFVDWARLRLGVRLPPGFSPADWYNRLAGLAPGAEVCPTGFAIPAYLGEKNTPLVRAFLAGIRGAGGSPGFVLKTGTADLNIVAPAWDCPAVAYGPGDSTLDHTPDEHISLEEYVHAVEVLQEVLLQLCSPLLR
jgi:LysW-gamma-L-lysine carboxypeptidase